ncbi:MAG TPA: acyltransferase, partial [Myxococcus sp.]|nr:acyltransferase [Myxococcus sp.]
LNHLDGLAMGVFLARTAPVWQRWAPRWRAACGALGAAVLTATILLAGPLLMGLGSVWAITGLSVGFGLVLVGVESLRLPAAPRWGIFQVAVLSYGAYLWHGLLVRVIERAELTLGSWPLDLLAYLAATLAVAWVTYVTVEQPGLRWRDRLLTRLAARERHKSGMAPG